MDDQYAACEGTADFERSLFVDARVVSKNSPNLVTVDAGLKAFATEGEPPRPVEMDGATYAFMGDEHGAVIAEAIAEHVSLGQRITLSVPHCDPTVNLYDSYHVLDGETLAGIWPVAARGRAR
jgi:3-hydroxy-D-aspartate aldolase